jgi:FkbH-like protein
MSAIDARSLASVSLPAIKALWSENDPEFWRELSLCSLRASSFAEVLPLSTIRKRALKQGLAQPGGVLAAPLKLAIVGGCSLFPFHDLTEHFLAVAPCGGFRTQLFLGDYDNYIPEILEADSALYNFAPDVVLLIPAFQRCRYQGRLFDPASAAREQAEQSATQLLDLCRTVHERSKAEVLLVNYPLIPYFDPGPYRVRTLASDWSFRKQVNIELGLRAQPYVHICDLEFLSARRGTLASTDERGWFESKQPCSADLQVDLAREVAHIVVGLRQSPKKIAVLDLDNTLWGGVIGDDGLDGIVIGDTSPRAEAFKSFQHFLKTLPERGILLAVCSKNDEDKALEPFEKHPEMVLRRGDFVSFKANWRAKSDNIREMALELNLGLDSFVFIDDNPAEIEIVRQFAPEVTGILLGSDPALYAREVMSARLFEPRTITVEDAERAELYKQEAHRQTLESRFADMDSYLESLSMKCVIAEFRAVDVPRIAQLIGRSNQFNCTTRRRTEAEVQQVIDDPAYCAYTMRLEDRFGDYGLIAVVIGRVEGTVFLIDTWLMSCRVLKRQVEEETVNEMVRLARLRGCRRLRGVYLPTKKNGMVRDLYPRMGFSTVLDEPERREFELDLGAYSPIATKIAVIERAEMNGLDGTVGGDPTAGKIRD